MKINVCPGCLAPSNSTYCPDCRKKLFNGNRISHILNFRKPEFLEVKREKQNRISISGFQLKHSLKISSGKLEMTERGGEYILKPVPERILLNKNIIPANEHLTMQIALQVFGINTAHCALVFFPDGEPAYLTKRFDADEKGERILQEDFAQIMNRSGENFGENYKYDSSYEEIALFAKKFIAAYPIEIEKFFRAVIFNYLFSNGDAHLKNFSLYRDKITGEYRFTPFYDLISTRFHAPTESDMALELFADDFESADFKAGSKYTRNDFLEFAFRIGINRKRAEKILDSFLNKDNELKELVNRSFLERQFCEDYFDNYMERKSRLIN
ncbi:MAG: HipA domain-containing protein [Ignavibacteriaceae bacterium]|jgi:serine/threonine-protein kinase HipA|nr:HipA domain-containing protein [Ignavibacteriaceae bacterium]